MNTELYAKYVPSLKTVHYIYYLKKTICISTRSKWSDCVLRDRVNWRHWARGSALWDCWQHTGSVRTGLRYSHQWCSEKTAHLQPFINSAHKSSTANPLWQAHAPHLPLQDTNSSLNIHNSTLKVTALSLLSWERTAEQWNGNLYKARLFSSTTHKYR